MKAKGWQGLSCLLLCLTAGQALAAKPTAADINASLDLRNNWIGLTRNIVFPADWVANSHDFLFRKTVAGGYTYIRENADTGKQQSAFDQALVAKGLSAAMHKHITALQLPIKHFNYAGDGIDFDIEYDPWHCSLKEAKCEALQWPGQPSGFGVVRDLRYPADNHLRAAPNGKLSAFVEGHNLVVVDGEGNKKALSQDGTAGNFYDPESIHWSPDSKYIVLYRVRPGYARFVTRVMSSPTDQLQPKVVKQLYPKPGDAIDIDQPVLFNVATGKETIIDNALFSNPYQLTDLRWRKDSKSFAFRYNQRGFQKARVIAVDASTGKPRAEVTETAKTFIYQDREFGHDVHGLGKEFIWLSERDGWAHLYLYNGKTGKVKNRITSGNWPVREVVKVDDDKRQIWFAASGMNKGEDPYFVHYYRINFDGSNLTDLTKVRANHHVAFSDDMKYYVDVYSRVDMPNVAELHKANGSLVRTIAKGDISKLLAAGFKYPEPFVAKGRDGKTDIYGLIVKPLNFDPKKHYPVIENIYAGPQDSFVPKDFWPFGYHSGGDKVIGMQELANLGFIVVQIDGMGTANRSKAFHDVIWKNLGDSGFPDRILWHKAAAKKFPWYDISHGVGIYGGSAGGQSTVGALEFHPEFYTVGVAFAGCYDNRMDKISWNEQWMGWPVDDSYKRSSEVVNADKLKGNVLIIFGEQDSNVDPSSSLQLVNALIHANKDFDLLEVPGGEHTAGRSTGPIRYAERRQFDFFIKHLLHDKTPAWNKK
ncbi:DPP IV N-terminal domain-containing protein [Gallaecimonas mangrovi]|uniref:DPP IV N-terminal domain-containing protein n=1 Tax=Gallaecimonas mangrovi TaxID=2291597 RepID=UPI001D026D25|nr:DPP IV N-terminal domain-containing protein [Gallaecimonas mangrovi]